MLSQRLRFRVLTVALTALMMGAALLLPTVTPEASAESYAKITKTGKNTLHVRISIDRRWEILDNALRSDIWVYLKENVDGWLDRDISRATEYVSIWGGDERTLTYDFDVIPEAFDGKSKMTVFVEAVVVSTQERYRSNDVVVTR